MGLANWTEIDSTIYGNPKLSSQARLISAKMMKLDDLVTPAGDFFLGKNSGDQVGFRLVGRIARDATTALGENTPVPFGKAPEYHATGTVDRYGHAVAWTGEREDLDRIDIEDTTVQTLTEHFARTKNKLIYNELVAGRSFAYVCNAATSGAWTTNGTPAVSATNALTLRHLQDIARQAMKVNMPYADGNYFVTALSPTAYDNLLADTGNNGFVDVKKYAASGAEDVLNNEVGKVGQHRIVVDNDILDDGIGTGSAFGSGFVTGHDAVRELPVYPAEFRYNGNLGGDFANQKALAWQFLYGWKTTWNYTSHEQGQVIHITST